MKNTIRLAAGLTLFSLSLPALGAPIDAVMYKNPTCTCCETYAAYLEQNGFKVDIKSTNDLTQISADALQDMEGKMVYGENGELLGVIATVDIGAALVDLHLTTGETVALDAGLLVNEPDHVIAPTLSMAEARALA